MSGMDGPRVEAILDDAERAVSAGGDLGETGFWKAVAAVKKDPALVEAHADRIARIDRAAFKQWAFLVLPIWLGNMLAIGATLIGLALVGWAYYLEGTGAGIAFLIGFGMVLVATHGLAHLAVGASWGCDSPIGSSASYAGPSPG